MFDKSEFMSLLQKQLGPVLKAQGFERHGFVYHRFHGVVTNAVRLEASNVTRNIWVNLGIHLTFLPTRDHQTQTPTRIEPSVCAFSQQLGMDDRETNPMYWSFGRNRGEAERSVLDLVKTYETKGMAFFNRWSQFPDDFVTLGAEGIDEKYLPPFRYPSTLFERATTLAHLHLHLGDPERAKAFALQGLQDASPPDPRRSRLERFVGE
jgi:hypothetical protein